MSLMSIRFGTNNVEKASTFYDATLGQIGMGDNRLPASLDVAIYALPGGPYFMIGAPRDGQIATNGNGDTLGFSAPDAAAVDRWYAAGLAHGGSCEGAPGPREAAGGRYGAYLRDPDGHKICAYAPS